MLIFQVIMIRSDPAECAMESRIAHEWDILGTGCCSLCLFSVCRRVSLSIYHYPTHTRPIFPSICIFIYLSYFKSAVFLSLFFYFQCPNALLVAPWLLFAFCVFNQPRSDADYHEQSNNPMRCHLSDGGAWTSFSWLMTSSYIHRPLHEGIRNRPLDFINQEGVQHNLSNGAHQKEGRVVRGKYFCPHISDASGVLAHIHLWATRWEHCIVFILVISLLSKQSSHNCNSK